VPGLDDFDIIASGIVSLPSDANWDALNISLGAAKPEDAPVLQLDGGSLGYFTTVQSTADQAFATLEISGVTGFAGVIDASADGGKFTIRAGEGPGEALVLMDGAYMDASGGDTIQLAGTLDNHGVIEVESGSQFIDNGVLAMASASFEVYAGGTLSGSGMVQIGMYSSLHLDAGAGICALPVTFTDVGGRLLLGDPSAFTGEIFNFQQGDLIDLTATLANAATYDATSGVLTVNENGSVVATLTVHGPASGAMKVLPDGNGGTLVEPLGTQDRLYYTAGAADHAMHGDAARQLTTKAGAAINGTGVKIGIISTSFDAQPGAGAADPANYAALTGHLPLNAASGTSAVTVLSDASGPGYDNEGLAMAELVHQSAPGAQLYFASGDGGPDALAAAVTALQNAGCTVIVDDLTYWQEPFFQITGAVDLAIRAAAASGVSYITSAGNAGAAAYQAAFAPADVTLLDGSAAAAQVFSNGTPYQTLMLQGGVTTTIALQWAVPWPASGQTVPDLLTCGLFDASGALVASGTQAGASTSPAGYGTAPETLLTFTPAETSQYRLYIAGDLPAGVTFKYILYGTLDGATTVPGTIDDPAATAGTVAGHAMMPAVTAVGAVDFATTPAYGSPVSYASYYSSAGGSQLLFDWQGNALTTPRAVPQPALLAPVGAATTVAGFAPFTGTSAAAPAVAAVAALMLQANPKLTPADIRSILAESATDLDLPASQQGAGLIDAQKAVQLALAAACYVEGTRIATARGPVAIERLRVGDKVRTLQGDLREVIWLGRRHVDCAAQPVPEDVWPVRVQAHAFAPNCPVRDLYLSPDHAVLLGGALVPVRYLVNDASIAQVPHRTITYWHLELPEHGVVLAENLPAESYLDTGNRAAFEGMEAAPQITTAEALAIWRARACAPLMTSGHGLLAARAALHMRAQVLGHALTDDFAMQVWSGGVRLPARVRGRRHFVTLPPGTVRVELVSRSFVPGHIGLPDGRRMGVGIGALRLDGRAVAPDDPCLLDGWHAAEAAWRWTAGRAVLRTGRARELAFDVALSGQYWVAEHQMARAA
jgi:hypothetical protein